MNPDVGQEVAETPNAATPCSRPAKNSTFLLSSFHRLAGSHTTCFARSSIQSNDLIYIYSDSRTLEPVLTVAREALPPEPLSLRTDLGNWLNAWEYCALYACSALTDRVSSKVHTLGSRSSMSDPIRRPTFRVHYHVIRNRDLQLTMIPHILASILAVSATYAAQAQNLASPSSTSPPLASLLNISGHQHQATPGSMRKFYSST